MKILVFGNGFIAASLIARLNSEGHEIVVFSRSYKENSLARQIIGDIADTDLVSQALDCKPDVVIQTAWITSHHNYASHPSNLMYSKITSNLAESLKQTEVKHMIILGTCAEYGPQQSASLAGITALNPQTYYAIQKVKALEAIKESTLKSGLRITWARIFQPYGPNQDQKRLVPYLIKELKNQKAVNLTNSSKVLDWISTRDIASAISWAINHELPTEIDVGTSVGSTNWQILQKLESRIGRSSQWEKYSKLNADSSELVLVDKDSPLLVSGWKPNDTIDTGLEWVLSSCEN